MRAQEWIVLGFRTLLKSSMECERVRNTRVNNVTQLFKLEQVDVHTRVTKKKGPPVTVINNIYLPCVSFRHGLGSDLGHTRRLVSLSITIT